MRTAEVGTPRCGTGDLNAEFGGVLDDGSGQLHIQLDYTNVPGHGSDGPERRTLPSKEN